MEMTNKGRRTMNASSFSEGVTELGASQGEASSSGVNEGDTTGGTGRPSSNDRASSSANYRNFDPARFRQRSQTFPPSGPASASNETTEQETNPGLVVAGTRFTDREAGTPLPQESGCRCQFPWTNVAPSNEAVCTGTEHLKVRQLSRVEQYHFEKPQSDPYLRTMKCSRVFEEPFDRLGVWPRFFKTPEDSGKELRKGFVTLWTTFILAETLLASVAIQPFVSNSGNLSGWHFEASAEAQALD
ncbi:unnamed protein product [Calypogeia fissa]